MKKKQAIAFLLSTAMTTGTVLPVFGASSDISGHWAEATITKWQNDGKIGGYEDGTFKPDKTITRAEFVRLLNTATTTAFTSSANISFSDVSQSDWFFADVAKAVGSGVTSGFEDGTFRPSETVTRAQAAVFICKAKGIALDETRANLFADAAEIPAWAKGAVGGAVNAGYLSGYPDGTFGANKGMTRAEAVSTLDRLSGTANQPADPNQGVSTPSERDDQKKEETTTTANAGDMVWTSGGSGGSRRGSSSSGGNSSSSSSNTISKNITINDQSDANDYKGKTITGKATIYAKDGLELKDIRFKGDVDIIANSSAVAAAYTDGDVAVAANYLADIKIYFEGRTNVSGTITVIKEGVPVGTQVVITTRTPRAISAIVKALIPTRIVGFEVPKVEASAPVEVAPNAKVGTITADDGASVVAEGEVDNVNVVGKVDNIELSGTGSTDVKVNNSASVEKIDVNGSVNADVRVNGNAEVKNVAISDKASADVAVNDTAKVGNVAVSDNAEAKVDVKDTAKVEKVDIADSAVAKVDVAPEAKVDAVTSTSTAPGSAVTGSGEVGKIEAPAGTMDKDETITTPIVTPPATEDNKKPETGNVAVTDISLSKTELSLEVGKSETLTATVTPDNATDKTVTWASDSDKVTVKDGVVTAVAEGTATITATTKDGGKTATCAVTVTAAKEPETPVTPTEPTTDIIKLVKSETAGKYVLTASGTAKYEYAFAADENAPAEDDAAWKPVTNAGTEITADTGMTYVHIRGVGGTSTAPAYSTTLPIQLSTITETEKAVQSISIDETLSLKVGGTDAEKTKKLTVTFTPADATNKAVTCTSGNEKVATVATDGTVTAVAAGTATITVKSVANPEATATCTVTVTAATQTGDAPTVTGVKVEKATTDATSATVTNFKPTAGKTVEYYAGKKVDKVEEVTKWETLGAADKDGDYTITVKADDEVVYFRYAAEKDAQGEVTKDPSAASTAVKIDLAGTQTGNAPVVDGVTAEKENAEATTVKVTGLTADAGKTFQYYVSVAEKTPTELAALEDTDWTNMPTAADDKSYTITGVANTNTVIYFRYAAGADATTEPASAASAKVDIKVAALKLSATVTPADIDLTKTGDKAEEVTVTVTNEKNIATTNATGSLTFTVADTQQTAVEDDGSAAATKVTIDLAKEEIVTGNKVTTITFAPASKTGKFEAGKTYTLASGVVNGADGKLFDIVPATATAEKGITFTTKAADDDNTDKVAANVAITENTTKDSIVLTFTDSAGKAIPGLALAEVDTILKLEATTTSGKVAYTTDKLTAANATIDTDKGTVTIKKAEFKKDTANFTTAAAGEYTLAITGGGFTSIATGESTAKAVNATIKSGNPITVTGGGGDDAEAKKTAANAEAAKITDFKTPSGSASDYNLTPTLDTNKTLTDGTTFSVKSVKHGTAKESATEITGAVTGAEMTTSTGALKLPVDKLAETEFASGDKLFITFTATLSAGGISDEVTVEAELSDNIKNLSTDVKAINDATLSVDIKNTDATDVTNSPDNLSCTLNKAVDTTVGNDSALNSSGKISKLTLDIASKKLQITAATESSLAACSETNVEFTGVTLKSGNYTYEMTVPVAVKVTVTPA